MFTLFDLDGGIFAFNAKTDKKPLKYELSEPMVLLLHGIDDRRADCGLLRGEALLGRQDAYVLLPQVELECQERMLGNPQPVHSQTGIAG